MSLGKKVALFVLIIGVVSTMGALELSTASAGFYKLADGEPEAKLRSLLLLKMSEYSSKSNFDEAAEGARENNNENTAEGFESGNFEEAAEGASEDGNENTSEGLDNGSFEEASEGASEDGNEDTSEGLDNDGSSFESSNEESSRESRWSPSPRPVEPVETYEPPPSRPQPRPPRMGPRRRYAAYNECMRQNRHVRPISARIEICAHLRP